MKEVRKPEYPEISLTTSCRKCHIVLSKPENSSPKQDSNHTLASVNGAG